MIRALVSIGVQAGNDIAEPKRLRSDIDGQQHQRDCAGNQSH
jgi:hypothetical protein